MGQLHYLLATVSAEPPYKQTHTLREFSENLLDLGCKIAYNLDGGQSATIVMNNEVKNYVYERKISDIIYFATAMPDGE
jgi:exopolysaccharide biosynthesis protein